MTRRGWSPWGSPLRAPIGKGSTGAPIGTSRGARGLELRPTRSAGRSIGRATPPRHGHRGQVEALHLWASPDEGHGPDACGGRVRGRRSLPSAARAGRGPGERAGRSGHPSVARRTHVPRGRSGRVLDQYPRWGTAPADRVGRSGGEKPPACRARLTSTAAEASGWRRSGALLAPGRSPDVGGAASAAGAGESEEELAILGPPHAVDHEAGRHQFRLDPSGVNLALISVSRSSPAAKSTSRSSSATVTVWSVGRRRISIHRSLLVPRATCSKVEVEVGVRARG